MARVLVAVPGTCCENPISEFKPERRFGIPQGGPRRRSMPRAAMRECITGLQHAGITAPTTLTFQAYGGIVPRHLYRRARYGAPAI